MKSIIVSTVAAAAITLTSEVAAFAPNSNVRSLTQLNGLFDGMKDAFGAPGQMSSIDSERETPIDRWMGWNAKSTEPEAAGTKEPVNFVDSMDESNYIAAALSKPMGIVFEENDEENGGIFVLSLNEGGAADVDSKIKPGDQLVAVNENRVAGFSFDDALGTIIDATTEKTKLVFFRGNEKQLYGPTGASKEWLDEFAAKGGVAIDA
mmetsp:Transcript_13669/g.19996  ORF Transcript_13669/g.19996 Transcript_13669/m.19996 type:complete len:207 (+) Transcript_13669:134-754(+)